MESFLAIGILKSCGLIIINMELPLKIDLNRSFHILNESIFDILKSDPLESNNF